MENESVKQEQGRPWKIEARFQKYEEAQQFKQDLQNGENPPEEIKIKHMASNSDFVVKTRRQEDKKTKKKK